MAKIEKYCLRNSSGTEVHFLNFGGIVTEIIFDGIDVIVGPKTHESFFISNPSYAGAIIGRVANRIRKANFTISGIKYSLFQNDGNNSLHGGKLGFDKQFWEVEELISERKYRLKLRSPDMNEGYPGNLDVSVIYSLSDDDTFTLTYEAETDQPTHVNLTSHCYFNLSGKSGSTILDHELQINAESFTEADCEYLPTGRILPVEGPVDFRTMKKIGRDIKFSADGYNHNYVVQGKEVAALLRDPESGRAMEVRTTEPGMMLYTGYYLELPYAGVALETQHYPDAPNMPGFPPTLLVPGEKYRQETSYRFYKT